MSISYSFSNKNSVFLKIIFMLVPSLLCKIIFPFCLIASMIKTCFCKYYRRLGQRFLCLLSYPPSCSWKKVGGFCRPPLKSGCKVPLPSWTFPPAYRNISPRAFQCPSSCSRMSFCWTSCGRNAYCIGLPLRHRWCQGGWHWSCSSQGSCASRCPCLWSLCFPSWRQSVCRQSALKLSLLSYSFFFGCYVRAVRTPPECSKFCFLGYGCAFFQPLFQTFHAILARDDCRMAVNGSETAAFIAVYPPL